MTIISKGMRRYRMTEGEPLPPHKPDPLVEHLRKQERELDLDDDTPLDKPACDPRNPDCEVCQ